MNRIEALTILVNLWNEYEDGDDLAPSMTADDLAEEFAEDDGALEMVRGILEIAEIAGDDDIATACRVVLDTVQP